MINNKQDMWQQLIENNPALGAEVVRMKPEQVKRLVEYVWDKATIAARQAKRVNDLPRGFEFLRGMGN
jgi:hypothetical protein